jgi:hypothetical protein
VEAMEMLSVPRKDAEITEGKEEVNCQKTDDE